MRLISVVDYPKKQRIMKIFSNQPGVQFYTGNFLPRAGMDGKVEITICCDIYLELIILEWSKLHFSWRFLSGDSELS